MVSRAAPFVDRHFATIVMLASGLFAGYMAGQNQTTTRIGNLEADVKVLQILVDRNRNDIADIQHRGSE